MILAKQPGRFYILKAEAIRTLQEADEQFRCNLVFPNAPTSIGTSSVKTGQRISTGRLNVDKRDNQRQLGSRRDDSTLMKSGRACRTGARETT